MEEKKAPMIPRRMRKFRKRIAPSVPHPETPIPEKRKELPKAVDRKIRDAEYEKKRVRKTIGFTLDEWEKIEEQLREADIDFTEFAKHKLLKNKIRFPAALKNEAEKINSQKRLYAELNAQGNNLNQIARKINEGDSIPVLKLLASIEKNLEAIRKSI